MGAALSTWELDLFGRIRSLSDKALESYLALDETRTATQLSLVAEVANAYLTLRADRAAGADARHAQEPAGFVQADAAELRHRPVDRAGPEPAEVGLRTAERNLSQYTRRPRRTAMLVLLAGQPLPDDLSAALDQP